MEQNSILLEFKDKIAAGDLLRIKDNIHAMVEQGAFMVKNGKVILHMDSYGVVRIIEFNYQKWKRKE